MYFLVKIWKPCVLLSLSHGSNKKAFYAIWERFSNLHQLVERSQRVYRVLYSTDRSDTEIREIHSCLAVDAES